MKVILLALILVIINGNCYSSNIDINEYIFISNIFIDPFHGGTDLGDCFDDKCSKDLTFDIAKLMEKSLSYHYTIKLSRVADQKLLINDVVKNAENNQSDLYIGIDVSKSRFDYSFIEIQYNGVKTIIDDVFIDGNDSLFSYIKDKNPSFIQVSENISQNISKYIKTKTGTDVIVSQSQNNKVLSEISMNGLLIIFNVSDYKDFETVIIPTIDLISEEIEKLNH